MWEGIDGVMVLHEVDAAASEKFLEWAYTGTYRAVGSRYRSGQGEQGQFPYTGAIVSILVDW